MKPIFICILLSLCSSRLFARHECGIIQFKKLAAISNKSSVTDLELAEAVQLLKKLELDNCPDYTGKNGAIATSRTYLFARICLRRNSRKAVNEYIEYLKRQRGSAEEQLSVSLEKIFTQNPAAVLSKIGNNHDLLNQLGWGFVNNHLDSSLKPENCKALFFRINPKAKELYPRYKKGIDYLINDIAGELKG